MNHKNDTFIRKILTINIFKVKVSLKNLIMKMKIEAIKFHFETFN